MANKPKIPLKMRLYLAWYPMKIFLKSLTQSKGDDMASFNLKGKKAVVFGVANDASIAWHIAKTLNDAGVHIALAYQDRAEQLVNPLLKLLDKPFAHKCDVVDDAQLDEFFKKLENEFGKFDILVHSIAFAKKEHLQGKFYEVNRRGYQVSQEVSSYSLAELTRRSLPLMNDNGCIIAMTYYGSEKVFPNYNVMGVAKAALEASVRYIAYDVGDRGIRVNAISAGPIKTLAASGIAGIDQMLAFNKLGSPLQRNIDADDVANLALFLSSDLAKNITGQTIYVDAGYSIMGVNPGLIKNL